MPRKAPPLDLAIRTEDCGCKVMSTIDEELWIEFCPLHEAAGDLLVACEAIIDAAASNLALRMVLAKTIETYRAFIQVDEAITKARGDEQSTD